VPGAEGPGPQPFRAWLGPRAATDALFGEYLRSLPEEWWTSERKACELQVGHGVRKSVAALSNGSGGQLFIGVSDDKSVPGTAASPLQVEQELRQPLAQPSEWYVVNLNEAVGSVTAVDLSPRVAGRRAFVLEIEPSPLPALVREEDGRLILYLRDGSSSVAADAVTALTWNRRASRERLLLEIFIEFRTMVRQVKIAHGYQIRLGSGFSSRLPRLVRAMEDGTLYRLLSEKDLDELLGRRTPMQAGDVNGFLSRFLDLEGEVFRAWRTVEGFSKEKLHHLNEQQVVQQLSNSHRILEQDLEAFRIWLVNQKILR
jgi:Putative DNA-binding domain